MDAATLPLFEPAPADQLVARLEACFHSWIDSAPARGPRGNGRLREESARIYADMWQAFIAFCVPPQAEPSGGERLIRLDPLRPPAADGREALDRQALLAFLEHEAIRPLRQVRTRRSRTELTPRYAWRLLQLIDRVLNHAREQEDQPAFEPALALMQEPPFCHANAAALTPVPEVLTDAQCDALIAHCTEFQSLDPAAGASWKVMRDRCALALMLGAGLAPGQVRALRSRDVSCGGGHGDRDPDLPWRLTIVADGSSPEHQVPLAAWAARQLRLWLAARRMLGAEMQCSEWVFPSTLSGKPWSHPACHRAAVTQLDALGIEGGAPFRLRHTFAVRQLQAGHAEEDVARWMGYVDTGPMKRYRHLLTAPVAGLA